VQNTCKPALIYLLLPSATPSPMLPVVSEWYQEATGDQGSIGLEGGDGVVKTGHWSRAGRICEVDLTQLETSYDIEREIDLRAKRPLIHLHTRQQGVTGIRGPSRACHGKTSRFQRCDHYHPHDD
jgi:hypothetical protein